MEEVASRMKKNDTARNKTAGRYSSDFDEYLIAMERVHRESLFKEELSEDMKSPREIHTERESLKQTLSDYMPASWLSMQEAARISTIASMVPDEIVYKHSDYSVRSYETALMFIDVSGFTDLCESYTKTGRGGPSKLTQVLNSYIGAMAQEIMTHNGDVLNFSGDAFLSMWKKTPTVSMQHVVHTAIDCGIIIQKNYGTYHTDTGVVLKDIPQSHYVIVGQPVWDVKIAEYQSIAGDVLTSPSAWKYVNETEYCIQPCEDGKHTKVLGVGARWKRVEKLASALDVNRDADVTNFLSPSSTDVENLREINYREYSLRPAVVTAMQSTWWKSLRPFMVAPVLRAVDNDEPMDFLTEVRRVVIVFINIVTESLTPEMLIKIVDTAYKSVCSVSSESGGLVNKVSMFDKDMMFLVVFGLRGLKQENEAQKSLQCAYQLKQNLRDPNITVVSIGITSGKTYCGVVGHLLRREYTVIGSAVNKAARLMMVYPNIVTCDKETFLRSKLDQIYFRLIEPKPLKGIPKPGPIYEFNEAGWPERPKGSCHPLLGRDEELRKFRMTLENAIKQQNLSFTRYRDLKYAFAIIGPRQVGKTRLMEECLNLTPNFTPTTTIEMNEKDLDVQFGICRKILMKTLRSENLGITGEVYENRIRRRFVY